MFTPHPGTSLFEKVLRRHAQSSRLRSGSSQTRESENVEKREIPETEEHNNQAKFHLSCPIPSVTVEPGETVFLQCFTKPEMDMSARTVEWLYNDKDDNLHDVFVLRKGKPDLSDQRSDYKGYAYLCPDELHSGNLSLNLTTQLSHSGKYLCRDIDEGVSCAVDLFVRPHTEITTPPGIWSVVDDIKPSENPGDNKTDIAAYAGIGGGTGSVIAFATIMILGAMFVIGKNIRRIWNCRRNRQPITVDVPESGDHGTEAEKV